MNNPQRASFGRADHSDRSDMYKRRGPLSPLRSPLNRKSDTSSRQQRNLTRRDEQKTRTDISTGRIKPSARKSWADEVEEAEKMALIKDSDRRERIHSESGSISSQDSSSGETETDMVVLMRRQKQIDYGKCTPDYIKYLDTVSKRSRGDFKTHPRTPNKFLKCSRRAWDGMIKAWRLRIHRVTEGLTESNTPQRRGSLSSNDKTPSTESTHTSGDELSSPSLTDKVSRKQLQFGKTIASSGSEPMDSDEEDKAVA